MSENRSAETQVTQAKVAHQATLLAKPNVLGLGTGYKIRNGETTGEMALMVLVREKLPPAALTADATVERQFNGVPTDVLPVGDLKALQAPTGRFRPAPGGVSIGHYKITAGTLGAVVRDRATGDRLILSNNHVLANSNDASVGDAILQPGPIDGGQQPGDVIAVLERFQRIAFSGEPGDCTIAGGIATFLNWLAKLIGSSHQLKPIRSIPQAVNLVDAALARPVNDGDVLDEIRHIGAVSGIAPATLGMAVRKAGRTTDFTTGTILVLDTTVTVGYGADRTAQFDEQIVTSPMSSGGDSGSLLVAGDENKVVGLLYAGSDQSTIHSPIQYVLDALNVEI